MYPNPQDVLPLPPRPDLDQYRKRAKDLAKACRSGHPGALGEWAARWIADLAALVPRDTPDSERESKQRAEQIADFARDRLTRSECGLSEAQFVIARAQGFESWPRFVHHIRELAAERSGEGAFERAADAIVRGDIATLGELLRADPGLVHARSTRAHRATLLHYISANGVENYRQVTPDNIVDIARLLLDAGAEVDAAADVYGGGATTLGLVVTSAHPRAKGVQNALADLLLDRGARLDPGSVRDSLMNGCPEAAEHLARRGLTVDLEEAAGIGWVDAVRRLWDDSTGSRDRRATAALMMAAWYGRNEPIGFLLDQGVDVNVRDAEDGGTALHVAAYNGHPEVVSLLVLRGADVDVIDNVYRTPPLVWALHAWLVENRTDSASYRRILRTLAESGARVKAEWVDDPRVREDEELWAMLVRS
jgi:hypothetical protein